MNHRRWFSTEKEALAHARLIETQIRRFGAQTDLPREKLVMADAYQTLTERLNGFGKTPEDAVAHYVRFLGDEVVRQAKPLIGSLVNAWEAFKMTDRTLSKPMVRDLHSYARFIKSKWGEQKAGEAKRNEIDVVIRGLNVSNNTCRKYLRFVRMFFAWVKDEGHIDKNPTDGIKYRPDDFNGDRFPVATTKKLLRHVADTERDLIGYYSLLTFAGLRPTEGARVQWDDLNFKTGQLYVRKGKTNARYISLEPVALAWMNWHRNNTPMGQPFVELRALPNREKKVRKAVLEGNWIQDGLRHGFATYYWNLKKDIGLVSHDMGNTPNVVKRHYARAIDVEECRAFWNLAPAVVLADEPAEFGTGTEASKPAVEVCQPQPSLSQAA